MLLQIYHCVEAAFQSIAVLTTMVTCRKNCWITAGVRAAGGSTDRTAAETPGSAGFAEQLKIRSDKLLHAAASSPPAAPSHGRAYRACREQSYGPIDHY